MPINVSEAAPAWIEPVPAETDLGAFAVADEWEISALLRMVIECAEPLTVYAADGVPCWAYLVAQDALSGELQLQLRQAGGLPEAGTSLVCVANLQGIKLQFSCDVLGPSLVATDDSCRVTRPRSIARLQRRRFLRIETPLGLPYSASLMLGGRMVEMGMDNLSLGGVALRASPREARLVYVGQRLPRVWLELGRDVVLHTELEVRSRRAWSSFLLGEQHLVGCCFTSLTEEARETVRRTLDSMFGNAAFVRETVRNK
jgi:hypothetical protein